MLFFTNQAPVNSSASSQFRARGNSTDVPTQPSDVNITVAPPEITGIHYSLFCQHIGTVGLSRVLRKDLDLESYNSLSRLEVPSSFMPFYPTVGVTFANNLSAAATELCERLGLTREIVNKKTFYRGTVDGPGAAQLLAHGAEVDPYLPYGVTTVGGLFAYITLRKILYVISSAFPQRSDKKHMELIFSGDLDSVSVSFLKDEYYRPNWVSVSEAKTNRVAGHCCPYFPGMMIPDKNFVPNFLSSTGLSRLLGTSHIEVSNSMVTLRKGWRSLCFTEPGMAAAHMFLTISYGLQAGMTPVFLSGPGNAYFGSVLFGDVTVLKGPVPIAARSWDELRKEIKGLDTHTRGLESLCQIFNDLEEDKTVRYEPALFDRPRKIHNVITKYTFNQETRANIVKALHLLDYPQTFWNPRNLQDLEKVINMIATESIPSMEDPIPFRSDVMFSTNKLQIALSLFGEKVPCFSLAEGGNPLPLGAIREDAKDGFKNPAFKKAGVTHVPVYLTGHAQAVAAWRPLIKNSSLIIKTKGSKPEGAFWNVPAQTSDGCTIVKALWKAFRPKAEPKKRSRAEEEGEIDEDVVRRVMKKLKAQGSTNKQFLDLVGYTQEAGAAMDEDE